MPTRAKKNLQREKTSNTTKKTKVLGAKRPNTKTQQGSYRIISGTWRSRRLSFPVIEGLRPTTDRVRETLFNWVSAEIHGAQVLDVFSGSGSLGLEALSRGATKLLAIEKNKQAALALQANLDLLSQNNQHQPLAQVVQADALTYLKSTKTQVASVDQTYDLIFLDPPFRKDLLEDIILLLDGHPMLSAGALIYIEREKELPSLALPEAWSILKTKTAGQVVYQLLRIKDSV